MVKKVPAHGTRRRAGLGQARRRPGQARVRAGPAPASPLSWPVRLGARAAAHGEPAAQWQVGQG
jgi:hypothetical protein